MVIVTLRHPMPESLLILSWSLPGDPLPDIICLSFIPETVSRSAPMENLCDISRGWGPMVISKAAVRSLSTHVTCLALVSLYSMAHHEKLWQCWAPLPACPPPPRYPRQPATAGESLTCVFLLLLYTPRAGQNNTKLVLQLCVLIADKHCFSCLYSQI